jgi:hypothetical protein
MCNSPIQIKFEETSFQQWAVKYLMVALHKAPTGCVMPIGVCKKLATLNPENIQGVP